MYGSGGYDSVKQRYDDWGMWIILFQGITPVPYKIISIATGDYFRAMGIPLRNGRLFAETDTPSGRPVAIVNDLIAQRHWPGANPVGERIAINIPDEVTEGSRVQPIATTLR